MIDLVLQGSADQFFFCAVQLLEFVQDYATAEPQAFVLRLACALTYIIICPAV
jgi:hypothetical protein